MIIVFSVVKGVRSVPHSGTAVTCKEYVLRRVSLTAGNSLTWPLIQKLPSLAGLTSIDMSLPLKVTMGVSTP